MNSDTLNHVQREALRQAILLRQRRAQLARLQAAIVVAQAPDYYQHNARRVGRQVSP